VWNGRDPIIKERLFGLSNPQGNHGEDVKELYYYLDATPTNSYAKMLYKYPQAEYPYQKLIDENARRSKFEPEYELLDTGLFDDDRYFDVFVEFAKAGVDDTLMRITAVNRGPDEAELYLLPHVWFRNTWSWQANEIRPLLWLEGDSLSIEHPHMGRYWLSAEGSPQWLFCNNDTNVRRLDGMTDAPGYFKDAVNDYLVHGDEGAVNPEQTGTKAAAIYQVALPAGECATLRLRLSGRRNMTPLDDFDETFVQRVREADDFYDVLQRHLADEDARRVQRQALAGMLWSKQFYHYDVRTWLKGDPAQPKPPAERLQGRNTNWRNLSNFDIISMPDKWEYPWYASWDLGFHCITLAMIDAEFAKDQLIRLTKSWYMHPTGQLPAYEWDFDAVNPPVHAWASWRVFQIDRKFNDHEGDFEFLEKIFHKMLINFTWWVNRKDAHNRNLFQGGFLGLDNIGVFDRDRPLPDEGILDQADGTSWMAMYCLNLMRMALELALRDKVYEDVATKFFEHFLQVAETMTGLNSLGEKGLALWDDEDEFYYDAIDFPDDRRIRLKIRSIVGLIPLFAVETIEPELLKRLPSFAERLRWFLANRADMCELVSSWQVPGKGSRRLLSLLRGHRMKRLLARMLDETEFLSDYGVRAVSRYHLEHPYIFDCRGQRMVVDYEPGESTSGIFGGNSNWRGPVWFPINYLLIESLQKFHHYYGDEFKIECPTGSGQMITVLEVAEELTRRLARIFLRDDDGRRAVFGSYDKLQNDPHFRDYVPFYEYFHGDTGRGVGASHQTGWTGLIAKLLQPRVST